MTERDFRQAFDDHKDAVYGFALRMTGSAATAEDIAFDATRGSLRAFLLGVTRHLALRRWREEPRLDSLEGVLHSSTPDLTAGGVSRLIAAAVQALPPLQGEAVLLFEYEGFTLEEIARIANADVGTVKSRLHRARQNLRESLAPLKSGVVKET